MRVVRCVHPLFRTADPGECAGRVRAPRAPPRDACRRRPRLYPRRYFGSLTPGLIASSTLCSTVGLRRGQVQPSGAACAPRGKRGEGREASTDGGAPHLPRQRPERLECALFYAPDLHPGHLRCAFYRRGDKLVTCYQVRSRRPNIRSDSWVSPVLPSVACARRSDSDRGHDHRLPPGHVGPDAAGGANLQVDRAIEPRMPP